MITERIKFWALAYFAKNACPSRFSLSSETAKSNDFYETNVYFPKGAVEQLNSMPKERVGTQRLLYRFIPLKNGLQANKLIKGYRFLDDNQKAECYVSEAALKHARIDVTYYLGFWRDENSHCTPAKLVQMVLWRKWRLMYLGIFYSKVRQKFRYWRISKRLRTPLRSKFEIYESLMSSDKFLTRGTFTKSDLVELVLGQKSIFDYELHRKFSQSLDWILEACVEDGEIIRVSHANESNPLYKMKGKGIHYFTQTKENIRNEEHQKEIQKTQVSIQNRMLLLTFLLVIATFMTAVDKFDATLEVIYKLTDWLSKILSFG
ncbi:MULTISPECIES: hypothetical protein [Vibrio]|uniref:hypothetical protein n=1 Tax=Vibrio TaxID=662 RepID=UPI001BD3439C|nr:MULTISPECIES: hypothetical protein [Vibrio]ELP6989837.1 hypothetical protein [Vibrio vulnificus]MBS9824533.1 hypothetical protein [Vibrio alginolyticus]MCA3940907.1 hypothetical protein [Vibrio vulnificus]MDW1660144.1 hypothetical protein [Vibrio sp. Vb2658]